MVDRRDYWATPHKDGWQVKREGTSRATSIHRTQSDAWKETKSRAKVTGGEAYLQNREGQIRERNTYGYDPKSSKG